MNCKTASICALFFIIQAEYKLTVLLRNDTGFTNVNCESNINEQDEHARQPHPCAHGRCINGENGYTCDCTGTGYTGDRCGVEIQECASNPCQNGGSCYDYIGFYNCSCQQSLVNLTKYTNGIKMEFLSGFRGVNCEEDINECDYRPSICLNNGKCINNHGGYQCYCGPDGNGHFTAGINCELRATYCDVALEVQMDPPACKNGGTCKGGLNSFTCSCAPGFTGRRCEVNIDECKFNPCQNNGTCIDLINGYNCNCMLGMTGANCEHDIDK